MTLPFNIKEGGLTSAHKQDANHRNRNCSAHSIRFIGDRLIKNSYKPVVTVSGMISNKKHRKLDWNQ